MKIRIVCLFILCSFSVALFAQDEDGAYGLPRIYSETPSRLAKLASANRVPTVSVIVKTPTADLVQELLYTKTFVVTEVPTDFSSKMSLKSPLNLDVVYKKSVLIQGVNSTMTPTYINGRRVRLEADGRFSVEQPLDNYGRFALYATFTTPDHRFFTLKRDVVSMATPPDVDQFALNKRAFVSFYNSSYFYNPEFKRLLSHPFTRADLAFFVSKLRNADLKMTLPSRFQDVSKGFWFAQPVLYAVSEHMMSEFPDGLFHPDQQVTRLEYIMTIVRALKLEIDNSQSELPYRDIKSTHWSAKFIRTALRDGLIKTDTFLNPNDKMAISDFMALSYAVPQVQQALAGNGGEVPVATESVEAFLYPILESLHAERAELMPKKVEEKGLRITSPKLIDITLSDSMIFEGDVSPVQQFELSSLTVIPSADGHFVFAAPLNLGKNEFSVGLFDRIQTFQVLRLESYSDLKGHWSEMTAAKLRFLHILDDEPVFYPTKPITREMFVLWLARALDWTLEPVEIPRRPVDLDENDPNYLLYLKAIQLGVLSADARGLFRAQAVMTKAEAVTALTQAVPLHLFPTVYTGRFPFVDIPAKHWARGSVELALKIGLIVPSTSFYPRRELSRAELVSMLYRLPSVQKRLDVALPHD